MDGDHSESTFGQNHNNGTEQPSDPENLDKKRKWIEATERAMQAQTIEELSQIKAETLSLDFPIGDQTDVNEFNERVNKRLYELFIEMVKTKT
jgi:hypothetical protein